MTAEQEAAVRELYKVALQASGLFVAAASSLDFPVLPGFARCAYQNGEAIKQAKTAFSESWLFGHGAVPHKEGEQK